MPTTHIKLNIKQNKKNKYTIYRRVSDLRAEDTQFWGESSIEEGLLPTQPDN